jgi:hypothetical protein
MNFEDYMEALVQIYEHPEKLPETDMTYEELCEGLRCLDPRLRDVLKKVAQEKGEDDAVRITLATSQLEQARKSYDLMAEVEGFL